MKSIMCTAILTAASTAFALQPGDVVPDIPLASTAGGEAKLSDFKGNWLVLYFYPKAFTPGCTAEACSLRDEFGEIAERGARILGVSTDDIETQTRFKNEYHLPFDLLSNTDKKLAKAFDSLMIGGLMTARKTFIIDSDGRIAHRFDKVNASTHADEVIQTLDALIAEQP